MHGFDVAFVVLSCQKAIILFSLQSRKFLSQRFFRLGQNTGILIFKTWETGYLLWVWVNAGFRIFFWMYCFGSLSCYVIYRQSPSF